MKAMKVRMTKATKTCARCPRPIEKGTVCRECEELLTAREFRFQFSPVSPSTDYRKEAK